MNDAKHLGIVNSSLMSRLKQALETNDEAAFNSTLNAVADSSVAKGMATRAQGNSSYFDGFEAAWDALVEKLSGVNWNKLKVAGKWIVASAGVFWLIGDVIASTIAYLTTTVVVSAGALLGAKIVLVLVAAAFLIWFMERAVARIQAA